MTIIYRSEGGHGPLPSTGSATGSGKRLGRSLKMIYHVTVPLLRKAMSNQPKDRHDTLRDIPMSDSQHAAT